MRPLDYNAGQLLRALARPQTYVGADSIAMLSQDISCWDEVLRGATEHGILPALYCRLAENTCFVPSDVLDRARREFERNAFHCMTNAEELLQVLSAFEKAGIEVMPFKGVVLGASAYGDMTHRIAGDIDLLIRHRDLQRASAMLRQRGYELTTKTLQDGSPEPQHYFEYHFERPSDGMVLELRWRLDLTQPRYRFELGLDWAWDQRRTIKLAGAEVPSLSPVKNILVLCMHGSKHWWSRLMWVCDVAQALKTERDIDWLALCGEAARVGLFRPLALGVMLATRLCGTVVPEEVLNRFERIRSMRVMATFLSEHLIAEPGRLPAGRIPYNVQLLGFRDRTAALLSLSFLRPNPQDRALIRLPKSLDALYYLVRPIRILLDRTGR
jgi:hypothetical protein